MLTQTNPATQSIPPQADECDGVDYSPFRRAAKCPRCTEWVGPDRTMKPEGKFRTRYHYCECGKAFKSIEKDPTM